MGNFISNTANDTFTLVTWVGVLGIASLVLFNYSASHALVGYIAPASDNLTSAHVASAVSAVKSLSGAMA